MTEPLRPHEVTYLLPSESPFEYELGRLINAVEVESHNAGFYTAMPERGDWPKLHREVFAARSALVAFFYRHRP